MAYDVKITGGTIVDGDETPAYRGDIGIKDGRIVAVGDAPDAAGRVYDADGALVTPGFVDIHTHYDGQVSWDETLAPSSRHGVTTCVMGNCGVGFAPVRPGRQQQLIDLMEGVEEIPGVALAEGMAWNWESFADYLDAIDAIPHAIDFCTQVTHDPLRLYVMGERAAAGEPATPEDVAEMRRLAADGLRAGAVGVSTGRTDTHRTVQGDPTPARDAGLAELTGLAGAVRDAGKGVVQVVSDFRLDDGPAPFEAEWSLIESMADAAGAPLSLSLLQRDMAPKQWQWILDKVERANATGRTIRAQVAARAIGTFFGFEATLNPLMTKPSYRAIMDRPLAERLAALRDPEVKQRILDETPRKMAGKDSTVPPLADIVMERLDFFSLRMFRLEDEPDYEPPMERSIYYEAKHRGVSVFEALYDAMLERDGRRLIYFPVFNYARFNLDAARTMLDHPHALYGLSDGGAHVGTVCDASFPTFILTHWVRDRHRGDRLPVETVVARQARNNARYMGLADRGMLKPGLKADINVIDLDRLTLKSPHMVYDLPAGGGRLMQDVHGYRATFVSGQPILEDDTFTDARPGRLVRA